MASRRVTFVAVSLLGAALLVLVPGPAPGYIHFPPPTLGALCDMAHDIYVLEVEKAGEDGGVAVFKVVKQLKGKRAMPSLRQVADESTDGAKVVRPWATKGKTAVLFSIYVYAADDRRDQSVGHVCIDEFWYSIAFDAKAGCWELTKAEPQLLTRYYGPAEKLRAAATDILDGKEVVVPCMAGGNKDDLAKRVAKVQRLRASLKLKDYDAKRDFVGWGADEK
jgi:hypothetical protein